MRKPWAVFIIIIAVIAAIRAVPCEAQTEEIAFTHVAVVDVRSGNISPDMTVLISGQKIREVGSSRVVHVPKRAHSTDARGKYLIPGLWDMHVHSLWNAERPAMFFPLFLANGVTGVREMGGPMPAADQIRWRDQVASGAVIGPRLVVPGPFVDGPHPVWPGSIKVVTADDGKKAVDSLKSAGADFLKVYTGVSRAAYFGIAVEAKQQNFPFVGHVPLEVGVDEASKAGQKSVEHLMGILLYSSSKSDELLADLMKGMNSNLLNNQMLDTYDPAKPRLCLHSSSKTPPDRCPHSPFGTPGLTSRSFRHPMTRG